MAEDPAALTRNQFGQLFDAASGVNITQLVKDLRATARNLAAERPEIEASDTAPWGAADIIERHVGVSDNPPDDELVEYLRLEANKAEGALRRNSMRFVAPSMKAVELLRRAADRLSAPAGSGDVQRLAELNRELQASEIRSQAHYNFAARYRAERNDARAQVSSIAESLIEMEARAVKAEGEQQRLLDAIESARDEPQWRNKLSPNEAQYRAGWIDAFDTALNAAEAVLSGTLELTDIFTEPPAPELVDRLRSDMKATDAVLSGTPEAEGVSEADRLLALGAAVREQVLAQYDRCPTCGSDDRRVRGKDVAVPRWAWVPCPDPWHSAGSTDE